MGLFSFFFGRRKPAQPAQQPPENTINCVEFEYVTHNGNSRKQSGELLNLEYDGDDDSGFYLVLTLKQPNGKLKKYKDYHVLGDVYCNKRKFSDFHALYEFFKSI